MAIPASVLLYTDWNNGTGTYSHSSPDKPSSFSWTYTNATLAVESGSPWNGQSVGKLTSWNSNITATLSSATMAATSGRIYIEFNEFDGGGYNFGRFHATNRNNGEIQFVKSGSNLRVNIRWNGDSNSGYVDLGTYPTVPYAVEVIYDTTNATANQRLRARTWSLGGSPGSFVDSTQFSSAVATDQFTAFSLAPDGEIGGQWVGRIAVSNSISEDLSALNESGGGTPVAVFSYHYGQQGIQ